VRSNFLDFRMNGHFVLDKDLTKNKKDVEP
jgi:hypothetical protein